MARPTRPTSDNYSFGVQHTALKAADGTPSGWFGIQRTDSRKVIGVSSEKYGIVKNGDVIDSVKEALSLHGQTLGEYDEEVAMVRVCTVALPSKTILARFRERIARGAMLSG